VTFSKAIDDYLADMVSAGDLRSERSVDTYRRALQVFADDVNNRNPRLVGREDVKRHLRRWPHPNTQRRHRSMLVSFFDWAMEEGHRKDNPARQTRAPKPQPVSVPRLTRAEVGRLLWAARTREERWVIHIGVCAGLRRNELRLLQGKHFSRPGYVWVSADIAKGGKERHIPVLNRLKPTVAEIVDTVPDVEFVFPGYAPGPTNPGWLGKNTLRPRDPSIPGDGKNIWRTVNRVGKRAGIPVTVGPHTMRHAFADHIAKHAPGGIRTAQLLLGHADVSTTQGYLGDPTLDEIAAMVAEIDFLSDPVEGEIALVETAGIEPAWEGHRALEPSLAGLVPSIGLYADHFRGVAHA
jgi:site-specific recombinase XerD